MISTFALIAEDLAPDCDSVERIDGFPALRVRRGGREDLVLVLEAKGGAKRLLDLYDELTALRAQRGVR